MFAICIEASHLKGMGHLFRMLNFSSYLKKQNQEFIFIINDNTKTKEILLSYEFLFEIVCLDDYKSGWELELIDKYSIKYWINDRLDTNNSHVQYLKNRDVKIVTFDDLGDGAKNSNINICGLFFNNSSLEGIKILKGTDYLILNREINNFKKERSALNNVLVTLGGSDTYGVTIKVLRILKKFKIKATIHIGPSFNDLDILKKELTNDYELISFIPSLIEEFSKFDLAITGGGVTPFEANASGLPCLIIANELFEIPNGNYLQNIGSSKFIGYYDEIDENIFSDIQCIDISKLSKNGLLKLNTNAVEKIYKEIILL